MKNLNLAAAVVFMSLSAANALEIPLGGSTAATGQGGGTSVGYVDMDRIFTVYPKTQIAKEDYAKQLAKKRQALSEKEAQVNNLKSRIAILESTMKQQGTTQPPDANQGAESSEGAGGETSDKSPQNLNDMKTQLDSQMIEYEDMRKQAEADLQAFQNQQSQLILGKIYEALRDLAQEEQVTIVVDKSSILYGDAAIDLTEKLQEKVRGY